MTVKKVESDKIISVKKVQWVGMTVPITGLSPYMSARLDHDVVMHSRRDLTLARKKSVRNLDEECERALYVIGTDKKNKPILGIPGGAFKKAMENAAIDLGLHKTKIKRLVKVRNEFVELKYKRRENRVFGTIDSGPTGAPNLTKKPLFHNWSCKLNIRFEASLIPQQDVLNLLERAGSCIGVGGYRLENDGIYGEFEVCRPK